MGRVLAAERASGSASRTQHGGVRPSGLSVAATVRDDLDRARREGVSVAGYGAPSKAPVLAALAGIDESLLPYTVDLSPEKHGRRLPGTRIQIFAPEELLRRQPEEVVVLTWDIIEEVTTTAAGRGRRKWLDAEILCSPAGARVRRIRRSYMTLRSGR